MGREFYFGFLRHNSSTTSIPYVVITAHSDPATVDIYNRYLNNYTQYYVESYSTVSIKLNDAVDNMDIGITTKVIQIKSDQDIKVTLYQLNGTGSEAYLVLPTVLYGKEYIISSYKPATRSQFLILAQQNDTKVDIRFDQSVEYNGQTYSSNDTLTIQLHQFQGFYFYKLENLTSTTIYSNKDIAVFSGNECANVPDSAQFCGALIEQLVPTSLLGRNYMVTTFEGTKTSDVFRITAPYVNTSVVIQSLSQHDIVSAGDFIEFELADGQTTFVSCSQPCLLVQFGKGIQISNFTTSPLMTLIPAMKQYKKNYIAAIPTVVANHYQFLKNYLMITIKESDRNGLRMNDAYMLINESAWRQVWTSNNISYVMASIPVENGTYKIHHINNQTFGLVQYGRSRRATSYGFIGGIKATITQCK